MRVDPDGFPGLRAPHVRARAIRPSFLNAAVSRLLTQEEGRGIIPPNCLRKHIAAVTGRTTRLADCQISFGLSFGCAGLPERRSRTRGSCPIRAESSCSVPDLRGWWALAWRHVLRGRLVLLLLGMAARSDRGTLRASLREVGVAKLGHFERISQALGPFVSQ